MSVGALIQADLSGVWRGLAPAIRPSSPKPSGVRSIGIVSLPAGLTAALTALEADAIAYSWIPALMRRCPTASSGLSRRPSTPIRPRSAVGATPPPPEARGHGCRGALARLDR